ncbi:MAG: PIG-L family deacetylase [Bryobacterales bacterium]|nr:PIG-L family deacetylase [Bryobacterales bacterium]
MLVKFLAVVLIGTFAAVPAAAQRDLAGAVRLWLALEQLNVLGSALMIAAHPDDENTALLTYLARGRKVTTAYLSLTRGEGGQNLIGPEQGDLLGVIRTQELLAARRIDGAEQFFTRAIDFGFSKSAEETVAKWGRDAVLGDIVLAIRRFRPDVIVLVFSGTPRDGHGHHQASALLGKEAFFAAADPARFPEQLRWVQPWQAKRVVWNVFFWSEEQQRLARESGGFVVVDTGEYDPRLGYSYAEIAGMSRSMHRSQGFGSAERRGSVKNYLVHVAGEPANEDLFDGVDTTWNRVPGGAAVAPVLAEALRRFDPRNPAAVIPLLLDARPLIRQIRDPWGARKLAELDEALALAAGLWLDASTDRPHAVPGSTVKVEITAVNRSPFAVTLAGVRLEGVPQAPAAELAKPLAYNQPLRHALSVRIPDTQAYSQPFWLRHPPAGARYSIDEPELVNRADPEPVLRARFRLRFDEHEVELERPVIHRYVDRAVGELTRPFEIVPPVAVRAAAQSLLFPHPGPKPIEVLLLSNAADVEGTLRLEPPAGWRVEPVSAPFRIAHAGEHTAVRFLLTPPAEPSNGVARAVATLGTREVDRGMVTVRYPHIEPRTVFPRAQARLVRTDVRTLARSVGYIMGAGDEVPAALRQLGCEVTLLESADLARGELGHFDAIVTGVRAFNVRADLRANVHRLLDYVERGGTLVVQYNVLGFGGESAGLDKLGPYPLRVGRARVSVEDAPVSFPDPDHPLLKAPNHITAADFDGWVQERGLYFAVEWDPRYQPLWATHDPGEKPLLGGTLVARHGKGAYVFTALSWFRQLPAGVPGAYRIFANLLSAAKVLP